MNTSRLVPVVMSLALLLSACGDSERYTALSQVVTQQNKTILDQQQTLLDQQQKLIDQEVRLAVLTEQMAATTDALRRLQDRPVAAADTPTPSKVDSRKVSVVRLLSGFSARLSANIGYGAYADSLGDLNSGLIQSMLDIKDQTFIDEANRVLCLYNYAGDFWQRFSSENTEEIRLNSTERYRFAVVGVNFVENYNPRPSDVKKFWLAAAEELQKLIDQNREALGRDDNNVRLFAR